MNPLFLFITKFISSGKDSLFFIIYVTMLGSMEPQRVPIIMPSLCKAHGGVHALAIEHCGYGRTVSYMTGDYF